MSYGVDVIGTLSEKLKQMIAETQEHFEGFNDSHKLYEQGNLNEKEYITKIINYIITSSAMNFLSIRVILENQIIFGQGRINKQCCYYNNLILILTHILQMPLKKMNIYYLHQICRILCLLHPKENHCRRPLNHT